jgi:hypothetical protein
LSLTFLEQYPIRPADVAHMVPPTAGEIKASPYASSEFFHKHLTLPLCFLYPSFRKKTTQGWLSNHTITLVVLLPKPFLIQPER